MLSRVAEKDFIVVQASWRAGEVLDLINNLAPSHIVVQLNEPAAARRYFLFRSAEAATRLAATASKTPIYDALNLAECTPAPLLDAYSDELDAPDFGVVVEEDYVVGFLDTIFSFAMADKGGGSIDNPARGIDEQADVQTAEVIRSVATEFPSRVALGSSVPLKVYLSVNAVPGSLTDFLTVGVPLDIYVEALRGFETSGPSAGTIMVREEIEDLGLQFSFKAVAQGLGVVRVYISQAGQSLGSLDRECTIVAVSAEAEPEQPSLSTVQHSLPAVQIVAPDLSLHIWQTTNGSETVLNFAILTREEIAAVRSQQHFDPVPLKMLPKEYFQRFFCDIDQPRLYEIEEFLSMRSNELFMDLFPYRLRKLLWELRDRIHSVQVEAADPWIPWELCKLQGWEDGEPTEEKFFCERFAVTRWLPTLPAKPILRLNNIALVVPEDSGLKHACTERDYLLGLRNGRQVEVIPATRTAVLEALASSQFDSWHFTCHGQFELGSNMACVLLQGADVLEPGHLCGLKIQKLGIKRPFVFLNACQTGQAPATLTGPIGWAERFLKAAYDEDHPENGASAFIGAYWSIDDEAAHQFAKTLYTGLLKEGKTIGDAALAARQSIRSRRDGSWLAYTVFAHPLAKVE